MGHYWVDMQGETEDNRRKEREKREQAQYDKELEKELQKKIKKLPKEDCNNILAQLFIHASMKAYTPYPLEKVYGPQKKTKNRHK